MTPKGSRTVLRGLVGSDAHPATQLIDFVAVLFGYAISGERTLEAFYEQPAALCRCLHGALRPRPLARALHTQSLFGGLDSGACRSPARALSYRSACSPAGKEEHRWAVGSSWHALGGFRHRWHARGRSPTGFASDSRPAACPETLGCTSALLATPGASVGKSSARAPLFQQAHSYQWLGSFRQPRQRALPGGTAPGAWRLFSRYLAAHQFPQERALLRLDGQYGTGAVLADLAGFCVVMRGKDYQLLDQPRSRRVCTCPQISSSLARKVSWCAASTTALMCLWGQTGSAAVSSWQPIRPPRRRAASASHAQGVVYELFFTKLPQEAFTASDVVALYLHRGAFEPTLADEDQEQDPDRWCSHAACWAGMLADRFTMGLEPAPGTGPSA